MDSSVAEEKSRRPSKAGEQVSKKNSSNGKLTLYVGNRTFFDYGGKGHIIDGIVGVDATFLQPNQRVFVQILAAFKYGREDRDVLGINFQKDLFLSVSQIYPPHDTGEDHQHTHLQDRILKRLKGRAYPFWFELPSSAPASVTVQPADGDDVEEEEELPCGVEYELRVFAAESEGAKALRGASVAIQIRRFAAVWPLPPLPTEPIAVNESFNFLMSDGALKTTAFLDKEVYVHGEPIQVSVKLDNESTKSVRGVEIAVVQLAEISLNETVVYKRNVETKCSVEGFPLEPGEKIEQSYEIKPVVKDMQGLAIDGRMKKDKTNLASSTITTNVLGSRENMGIVVSYQVKVKMVMSMAANVTVDLPFALTHVVD